MNHSEPNGEYNWSGFRIPFRITPRVLFEGLISGMLTSGLFILGVTGGSETDRMLAVGLVAFPILVIWKLLEQRLDRIESKLSN